MVSSGARFCQKDKMCNTFSAALRRRDGRSFWPQLFIRDGAHHVTLIIISFSSLSGLMDPLRVHTEKNHCNAASSGSKEDSDVGISSLQNASRYDILFSLLYSLAGHTRTSRYRRKWIKRIQSRAGRLGIICFDTADLRSLRCLQHPSCVSGNDTQVYSSISCFSIEYFESILIDNNIVYLSLLR